MRPRFTLLIAFVLSVGAYVTADEVKQIGSEVNRESEGNCDRQQPVRM